MKYHVSIADQQRVIQVLTDQYITVDGEKRTIDVEHLGPGSYHVLAGNKSYRVLFLYEEDGNQIIRINGKVLKVNVQRPHEILQSRLTESLPDATSESSLKAPMAGKIIEVLVQPGQRVAPGTILCVLEAMKMENTLKASSEHVVKEIHFAPGETVEKQAVLISFED